MTNRESTCSIKSHCAIEWYAAAWSWYLCELNKVKKWVHKYFERFTLRTNANHNRQVHINRDNKNMVVCVLKLHFIKHLTKYLVVEHKHAHTKDSKIEMYARTLCQLNNFMSIWQCYVVKSTKCNDQYQRWKENSISKSSTF